jgi:hypothetical protein
MNGKYSPRAIGSKKFMRYWNNFLTHVRKVAEGKTKYPLEMIYYRTSILAEFGGKIETTDDIEYPHIKFERQEDASMFLLRFG